MSISKKSVAHYHANIDEGEYLGSTTEAQAKKDYWDQYTPESISQASDRQLLNLMSYALSKVKTPTLKRIRKALERESYICVGNWFDTTNGETQGSGCLFGAAYFQTKAFKEALKACAHEADPVEARLCAIGQAESNGLQVAEAVGIDETLMGSIIDLFDTWGSRNAEQIVSEWNDPITGLPYTHVETVLSKRQRKTLLGRIDAAIASRSKK